MEPPSGISSICDWLVSFIEATSAPRAPLTGRGNLPPAMSWISLAVSVSLQRTNRRSPLTTTFAWNETPSRTACRPVSPRETCSGLGNRSTDL